MKRILSGVQPSGQIHLGNYLGAIRNHIEMQKKHETYLFIADLHALTTVRDPKEMQENILNLTKAYIALGLDTKKTVFFQQSALPEHAELCWILDSLTPMGLLERAHAWKDAKAKGTKEATVGLFNYPVLQAADILLYKPDLVPVGQDQKQHIEMTRDIATKFNQTYGETFSLPEPFIEKEVATVPGTDGRKMSKSYGNTIDIFAEDKTLKKQVMGIQTDSTPLEKPKDPKKCLVFTLYSLLATTAETTALAKKYKKGGFGYGDAKKLLLAKIENHFGPARKTFFALDKKPKIVQNTLLQGNKKAKAFASKTLEEVKKKAGLI
jgi:tryptophanyl-tRNA synthetase